MKNDFVIHEESLQAVEGTTLFYPCSGQDLLDPLRLFLPSVTEFWFVDVGYFRSDVNRNWAGKRADQVSPVLLANDDYELIEIKIDGPPTAHMETRTSSTNQTYPYLEPCVLTETYIHRTTSKSVKVHRRRGFGQCAFDKVISSLGVFYYRGDSDGEGGSGFHWLRCRTLKSVLSKLISGGLVVTDGSQHDSRKYRQLWRFHCSKVGNQAMQSVKAFTRDGCEFACVGYAGEKYGPTLIWRVLKQV